MPIYTHDHYEVSLGSYISDSTGMYEIIDITDNKATLREFFIEDDGSVIPLNACVPRIVYTSEIKSHFYYA